MKLLIIGGSGFVSGTLARIALEQGHQVSAVTRGQKSMPAGVRPIVADRGERDKFAAAIEATGESWDAVVDCIGFTPEDVRQDSDVFRHRARHLIFISTDFVIDPTRRVFPQGEEAQAYATTGYGHQKRLGELELMGGGAPPLEWTILRPCHIYGPGSLLGCLPDHGRDPKLLERLRAGEALRLVGDGHFLQQPIFAADLARLILSCAVNPTCFGQLYHAAGPEIVESREYYRLIAEILDTPLRTEELPVAGYLAENPAAAPFLCHRIYDLSKLRAAGLAVPSTPLAEGLRQHVESLSSQP